MLYLIYSSQKSTSPAFCEPDTILLPLIPPNFERNYLRSLYMIPYVFHPYPPGVVTEPGIEIGSRYFTFDLARKTTDYPCVVAMYTIVPYRMNCKTRKTHARTRRTNITVISISSKATYHDAQWVHLTGFPAHRDLYVIPHCKSLYD
jgi:hypothetical protein